MSEDVARLQIVYQAIQNGVSVPDAVKQLDAIFPTNRISEGQQAVANKVVGRQIARGITSPAVTQFAGYHASLFQTLTNDVKQLVGKLPEGGSKAEAADRIAALVIGLAVLYPAYDAILKAVTKNPNAVAKRGGIFAVLYNIEQLMKGKENLQAATQATFTPSPVTEAVVETALNRDLFTGDQPIPQGGAVNPLTVGKAFGSELGSNVSLAENASQVASGSKPLNSYLASLVGVSIPKSSPSVSNLDSLIYDQRPTLDTQLKAAVAAGDTAQATQIMGSFNKELLNNIVDALIENKQPSGGLWGDVLRQIKIQNSVTGNTDALKKQILADPQFKAYWLTTPSATVMKTYKGNQGKSGFQKITGQ
jgi:hypothetical protein